MLSRLNAAFSLEVLSHETNRLHLLADSKSSSDTPWPHPLAAGESIQTVDPNLPCTKNVSRHPTRYPIERDIFIPHINSLSDSNEAIKTCRRLRLNPVPHVAARRIRNFQEVEDWCAENKGRVEKILMVGGGGSGESAGPFDSTMEVLDYRLPTKLGAHHVGFAGHPEGNPFDPSPMDSLSRKVTWAQDHGLESFVVTQICFDEERIVEFVKDCREHGIDVPIHAGISGPVTMKRLKRMTKFCSPQTIVHHASLGKIKGMLLGPSEAFLKRISENVAGFHVYGFGKFEDLIA